METWKFFDITHKEHVICNPSSLEKYQQLINLLRLPNGAQVLEIAMGKGEFIIRLAERKQKYLRWGRDTLGWALYLFRKTYHLNNSR